jgi:hypothetical protein
MLEALTMEMATLRQQLECLEGVGFRNWQSVFRIDKGHKFASGHVARDAAQNQLMGFDLNAFIEIRFLKDTCCGEESDSDLGA